MKQNAKLILCSLWREDMVPSFSIERSTLDLLIPGLSYSGKRSLYAWLVSQNLLTPIQVGSTVQYTITGMGMSRLTDEFPALNPRWRDWKGDWRMIAFCNPPKGDPQFRYLRKQCVEHKALTISRGIYAFAGQVPAAVLALINRMYRSNVSVISINRWEMGLDPSVFVTKNGLHNLGNLYSGISKEAEQLLASFGNKKRLTDAQKPIIREIYNRALSLLEIDPGYTRYYYPTEFSAPDVILKLQRLLRLHPQV